MAFVERLWRFEAQRQQCRSAALSAWRRTRRVNESKRVVEGVGVAVPALRVHGTSGPNPCGVRRGPCVPYSRAGKSYRFDTVSWFISVNDKSVVPGREGTIGFKKKIVSLPAFVLFSLNAFLLKPAMYLVLDSALLSFCQLCRIQIVLPAVLLEMHHPLSIKLATVG
jgi:hypothetical protein